MDEKLKQLAQNIKPNIRNEIKNDKLIITLSGSVGKSSWYEDEDDYINEKRIKSFVNNSDKDIVIRLNSPGGDAFEGIAIYNYLKDLDNHITIEVTALAASAASIITMAGDEIVMCTGSQMMIHKASTITWGDESEHQKSINALRSVDDSIVSVYTNKTGLDKETVKNWLTNETWFTADEAVENGLADKVKDYVPESVVENSESNIVTFEVAALKAGFGFDEIEEMINKKIEDKLSAKNKTNSDKPKTGLNKLFKGAKK